MNVLTPINNNTLSFQVFETLRKAIIAREIHPGDSLREAHLARQLKVSQVPVREALLQLEHLGLVTRIPNKGTYVTELTKEEIRQRLQVRVHLEELAFIEAARQMNDDDFAKLEALVEAIITATTSNNYFETSQADLELHRFIWKKSGNSVLYDTLNQLTVPLYAFVIMLRKKGGEDLKETVASHDDIVTALKSRDAENIKTTLRQHLDFSAAVPKSMR